MSIAFPFVLACAVCGAGEKTLPSNGTEVAFAGRKRATLELRAASFETTDHALRVVELRAEPGLAMAVGSATIVAADVPVLRRSLALEQRVPVPPADRTSSTTSLGDVELRASHTAWKSAPALVTERLTIAAGVKLPTAPLEHDPAGALVHPDLQPGCGSIVPLVAISYAWTSSFWSAWTGASLLFPVEVRAGSHPGDSLRASFTLQLQPARVLATRLGVHGRLDSTGELDGEVVHRSGGASVFVAPELVASPTQDVVVSIGAAFPMVQEMRGYRATAPVLLASVGVDF
ncbi:MAG: hypothetical protein JWO86_5457 [Myxococcaceae bacterium]|nr:hypothetical protein [Myxococcaceae bacterium]